MSMQFIDQLDFVPNVVFECAFGSKLYGTALPDSDDDRRGIFTAAPADFASGRLADLQINSSPRAAPVDRELHELSRFMRLCAAQNPGFVELLWVPDACVLTRTPAGDLLRAHRRELLSARIAGAMVGLAKSNVKQLVKRREKRLAAADAFVSNSNERNAKLEEAAGYDAKAVATVVRLLRMAREALNDGELRLVRPDAAELIAIRQGALPFEGAVALVDDAVAAVRRAERRTALPSAVDARRVEALQAQAYALSWQAAAD